MATTIAAMVLGVLGLLGAYFCALEYKYLKDQAREVGDISIVRWQRVFGAGASLLLLWAAASLIFAVGSVA